jgi:trimeric autotransporter adhesin
VPPISLTRVRPASHGVIVVFALMLCAALSLASAAPASAITRKQAANKALAALGSSSRSNPVIVFGAMKPLREGTPVAQAGTRAPWKLSRAAFRAVRAPLVARVGGERAFFFYEDLGPFRAYPHAGRVALVGARSGKVKLSRTIVWPPLVNRKLPAFLTSSKAYRSSRYHVFYRPWRLRQPFGPLAQPNVPNSAPKADGQVVTAKQGSPKHLTLTASDDDGDLLTFHITKQPNHGTLSGQPPDVTYTSDPAYLGNDKFSFKANDGDADSNAAQVSIDVVPVGVAPTVITSAGCTAYTEQAPAVAVDDQLTVADPDDAKLDSASVRISTNFEGGDDLLFTDQNGIIGSYSDNTGTLTLTGTSSVANYQAALRSVRYRNLASGNPSATKNVEFTVNDAGSDSVPATKQICITGGAGGNDKPIGETGEGSLSYIENDGPVPVDGLFVVGDPDSANLSGATIKFIPVVSQPVDENGDPVGPPVTTVTFAPDEDELAFVDQNGITGSYNDSTGELTLTGTASLANYEAAIRSVTYENSSEDPSDAQRRLQFQVTDSAGANSTPSRRDIFVTPVNDAPVVTTTAGSTSYTGADPPVAIDSGLTAGDVDDDDLEGAVVSISSGFESGDDLVFVDQNGISGVYNTGTGVLTLTGTSSVANYQTALRSVKYGHTGGNPAGSRTVDFTVNDGDLDSAPATKTLELNDKPVLNTTGTALSYTEGDGPVAVDSGITAADADSATLAGATVQITGGFVSDQDELAFTDQNGISGTYDAESALLTLSGTASVANYQAALRSVTYENISEDPTAAPRTITFQVNDGETSNNLSDPATREIDVTPVNDAPVVTTTAGSVAYTEGDPRTTIDSGLTVADVDDTNIEGGQVRISSGFQSGDDLVYVDQLGISGVYNTGTGVLTLSGTASVSDYQTALQSIEYQHTGDDPSASKTVEFKVNDGDDDSNAATKDIAVTAVNDQPALDTTNTALSYTEGDGPVAVDSGITATDPDSASLSGATVKISSNFVSAQDELTFVDQNGIAGVYDTGTGVLTLTGSASVADYQTALRSVTYTNSSATPSTATRTVTFQVDDGAASNNLSNAATRDIEVADADAAPVVTTSAGSTSYTEGDNTGVDVDAALTVTDADDTNIEGGQVRISSGFEVGDDLVYVDQLGISGVYNTGTGVLTLTGTASVSDYQTALRSIAYRHTGVNTQSSKTVEFKVNDGDVDSNNALKSIDITPA